MSYGQYIIVATSDEIDHLTNRWKTTTPILGHDDGLTTDRDEFDALSLAAHA